MELDPMSRPTTLFFFPNMCVLRVKGDGASSARPLVPVAAQSSKFHATGYLRCNVSLFRVRRYVRAPASVQLAGPNEGPGAIRTSGQPLGAQIWPPVTRRGFVAPARWPR